MKQAFHNLCSKKHHIDVLVCGLAQCGKSSLLTASGYQKQDNLWLKADHRVLEMTISADNLDTIIDTLKKKGISKVVYVTSSKQHLQNQEDPCLQPLMQALPNTVYAWTTVFSYADTIPEYINFLQKSGTPDQIKCLIRPQHLTAPCPELSDDLSIHLNLLISRTCSHLQQRYAFLCNHEANFYEPINVIDRQLELRQVSVIAAQVAPQPALHHALWQQIRNDQPPSYWQKMTRQQWHRVTLGSTLLLLLLGTWTGQNQHTYQQILKTPAASGDHLTDLEALHAHVQHSLADTWLSPYHWIEHRCEKQLDAALQHQYRDRIESLINHDIHQGSQSEQRQALLTLEALTALDDDNLTEVSTWINSHLSSADPQTEQHLIAMKDRQKNWPRTPLEQQYDHIPSASTPLSRFITTLQPVHDFHQHPFALFSEKHYDRIKNTWIPQWGKNQDADKVQALQQQYTALYGEHWLNLAQQLLDNHRNTLKEQVQWFQVVTDPKNTEDIIEALSTYSHDEDNDPEQSERAKDILYTLEALHDSSSMIHAAMEEAKQHSEALQDALVFTQSLFHENKDTKLYHLINDKNHPTLANIAQHLWRSYLNQAYLAIEAAYQQDILPFYQQQLAAKYPMLKSATEEIDLDDFVEFFSPQGRWITFYEQYLQPFMVDDDLLNLHTKSTLGYQLLLENETLAAIIRAYAMANIYFTDDTLSLDWVLEPPAISSNARSLSLEYDAMQTLWDESYQENEVLHWPVEDKVLSIEMINNIGKGVMLSKQGAWAIFHLFDDFLDEDDNTLTITLQEYSAQFNIYPIDDRQRSALRNHFIEKFSLKEVL